MSDPYVKPAVVTAVGFAADRANQRAAAGRNVSGRQWLVSEADLPDDERVREARLLFAHWQAEKVIRPAVNDAYNEAAAAALEGPPPAVPDEPAGRRKVRLRIAYAAVPVLLLTGILSIVADVVVVLLTALSPHPGFGASLMAGRSGKRRRLGSTGRYPLPALDDESHPVPIAAMDRRDHPVLTGIPDEKLLSPAEPDFARVPGRSEERVMAVC